MKSFIADKNCKLSKLALDTLEDLTYPAFSNALKKRDVKVDGKRINKDVSVEVGDKVEIYYVPSNVKSFDTIYVDENVLLVCKKKGFLSEKVFESAKQEYHDVRFIHRLDRNTDGVMVFALNEQSEKSLLKGFKDRTFIKKYHALVVGVPKKRQAILTAYLVKDADNSTVKIFDKECPNSSLIKTGYKVLEERAETALLEVDLFTGKTHQIRAHLSHVGYPIVGDGKYGDFKFNNKVGQKVQQLTAVSLTFNFPKEDRLFYLNGKTFTINQREI